MHDGRFFYVNYSGSYQVVLFLVIKPVPNKGWQMACLILCFGSTLSLGNSVGVIVEEGFWRFLRLQVSRLDFPSYKLDCPLNCMMARPM